MHKFLSFTFATIAFIPYLLSTCIMVILTWSVMTYILVFRGRAGTVKLPNSDERNDDLTTYAKFWTQRALSHSTNARSRKTL